jgi:hypothetical protein
MPLHYLFIKISLPSYSLFKTDGRLIFVQEEIHYYGKIIEDIHYKGIVIYHEMGEGFE